MGGPVRIAGYANKFGIDSYNTRLDPASMRLDRFGQNGMLLFNHDVDKPVGKVTKVEKRDDGVYVECELSKSDAEWPRYVRDLVGEGCLRTFSVRFGEDATYEKDADNPGGMIIRNWELQEVSIVSIPAQPDSTFSLVRAQRAFANVHSLEEARAAVDNVRGSKVAKAVSDALKQITGSGQDNEDVLGRLGKEAGLEPAALSACLGGETTPAPEGFLAACVSVLGLDKEELDGLNAQDVESDKEPTETPADVPPKPDEGRAPEAEQKPIAPPVPPPAEADKATPPPSDDQAVQACVAGRLPGLLKEGKSQEDAVAEAIQACSKERGCVGWRPTREALTRFADVCRQANQEPGPTVPVQPVEANENALLQKLDTHTSLLGALIEEVKGLRADMQSRAGTPVPPPPAEKPPAEGDKKPTEEAAQPARAEDGEKPKEEANKEEDLVTERAVKDAFERIDARLRLAGL